MLMATPESVKPGTLCCILCRGIVQYKNRDNAKFVKHMENEHGAYFDLEFILATCFMDEDEKKAVKSVIETKNVDDDQEEEEDTVAEVSVKRERVEVDALDEEQVAKVARVDNSSSETYSCDQCGQRFEETEHLRIHVKVMHNSRTDKSTKKTEFHCEDCDQYFCRKDALRIHRGRKHEGAMPEYMTPEARRERDRKKKEELKKTVIDVKKFTDEVKLGLGWDGAEQKDVEVKSEILEESIPPTLTEGSMPPVLTPESMSPVLTQENMPQENIPPVSTQGSKRTHNCLECPSQFSSQGNLKKHERKFHGDLWNLTTTNQFSCEQCDIKYSSGAALANHNKWKHGDNIPSVTDLPPEQPMSPHSSPFSGNPEKELLKCTSCDKTFTRRDNMNKHIKKMHPDGEVNPFQCNLCDFYSPRRDRVDQHMEKEHGDSRPSSSNSQKADEPLEEEDDDSTPTIPREKLEYWQSKIAELEDNLEEAPENTKAPEDTKAPEETTNNLTTEFSDFEEPVSRVKPDPDSEQDIANSKYFRMNSYAICSLGQYSSGGEEDFKDCFDLPSGWKFRFCGPAANPEKSTHFITPDR